MWLCVHTKNRAGLPVHSECMTSPTHTWACWLQVHNVQQSVIDTKNQAVDKVKRFWQTAFPKNQHDELLSQGAIPSNTAAVGRKPQGHFSPTPAPAYSWRGRNWADQKGHLQRGGAGYDPVQAYHEARERGDFLGKAEWKGRQGVEKAEEQGDKLANSARDTSREVRSKGREAWEDAKEEGEEFVESAKARGRQGWERTKEEWEHLKETVSSGTGMFCPALYRTTPPCPGPSLPCPCPALPCPTVYYPAPPCPAVMPCPCSAWLYQTLPRYTQSLQVQPLEVLCLIPHVHGSVLSHNCCL